MKLKFVRTGSDPCIYYQKTGGDIVYVGVYVDDIILAEKLVKQLEEIKRDSSREFDIKYLEKTWLLSWNEGGQSKESQSIWIERPTYAENLLRKHFSCRTLT